jgi:hypothetical protein
MGSICLAEIILIYREGAIWRLDSDWENRTVRPFENICIPVIFFIFFLVFTWHGILLCVKGFPGTHPSSSDDWIMAFSLIYAV